MDYEKKLRLAKEALDSGSYDKETIEYIFPELKKNIDETNIKNLIDELKCSLRAANCQNDACGGGHEKRIALLEWGIAWLEKQGKHKPTKWSMDDELNCNQAIYVCHQYGYFGVETWLESIKKRMKGK